MARTAYFDGTTLKAISLQDFEQWTTLFATGAQTTPQVVASTVAFLYRCIDVRANAVASLPWAIYRGDTEIVSDDVDEMPDELLFMEGIVPLLYRSEMALTLGSRAYMLKLRNRVQIKGLQWLDPSTMEPVWTPKGITGFKRQINKGQSTILAPEDVIYLWLQGASETEPRTPPAQAALNAAQVLANVDAFAAGFFKRGAIKGTILQVPQSASKEQKDKLKSWWTRQFGGGTSTAWEAAVVSSEVVPVVIGEGISELSSANLTNEKREDIATAMGVPHSLVLSNAANYATSQQDTKNFYDQTVLPAGKLIQRALNAQLFGPIGYRFEFRPEQMPVYQADENERATSFAAYVGAGVKPSIAAQILGIDLPEGIDYEDLDPEPQPMQLQPVGMDATSQDDADAQEREAEAARFKRWAAKRKEPDVTAFKSDILSDTDKEALLGHSAAPFGGESIRDWYKAVRLQLDPSDPEAEHRIKLALEAQNATRVEKGLREWLREVFPPGMSEAGIEGWATRLEGGRAKFRDVLERVLIDSSDLGVTVAIDQLGSIGFDYTLVNARAREAASRYSYELVGGITDNTRRALQESVSRWAGNGEPLSALIRDIAPVFGDRRASLIAATETTRAFAQGNRESYRAAGVQQMEWMTANDELVCDICGALAGKMLPIDAPESDCPPAHPNCRCDLAPVVGALEPLQ